MWYCIEADTVGGMLVWFWIWTHDEHLMSRLRVSYGASIVIMWKKWTPDTESTQESNEKDDWHLFFTYQNKIDKRKRMYPIAIVILCVSVVGDKVSFVGIQVAETVKWVY